MVGAGKAADTKPSSPDRLTESIEAYLADHPAAAVLEDGRVLFEMRAAHYAISESHGRCQAAIP